MSLVAMKVWIRGSAAPARASPAPSMSASRARARPQIWEPRISSAMALTEAKSPLEAAGKPASITSTRIRSSARAICSFSSAFMDAPGLCSPSRRVVSKIRTRSAMVALRSSNGRYRACGWHSPPGGLDTPARGAINAPLPKLFGRKTRSRVRRVGGVAGPGIGGKGAGGQTGTKPARSGHGRRPVRPPVAGMRRFGSLTLPSLDVPRAERFPRFPEPSAPAAACQPRSGPGAVGGGAGAGGWYPPDRPARTGRRTRTAPAADAPLPG